MKINSVNAKTRISNPAFKAKMTKNVERGFNNLGYRIKECFGENSQEYRDYRTCMDTIKEKAPDMILDDQVYTSPHSSDELGLFPYTFSVFSKETGKNILKYLISEPDEDSLYTQKNLTYLAALFKQL